MHRYAGHDTYKLDEVRKFVLTIQQDDCYCIACCVASTFAPDWEPDPSENTAQQGQGSVATASSDADPKKGAFDGKTTPSQLAPKPAPVKNSPMLTNSKLDAAKGFLESRNFGLFNGWTLPLLGKCAPACTACNIGCLPCGGAGCIGCLLCNYCGQPRYEGCIYACDARCKTNCTKAQLVCGPIEQTDAKLPCCGDCCDRPRECADYLCPWEFKPIDESRIMALMLEQAPGMQEMAMLS